MNDVISVFETEQGRDFWLRQGLRGHRQLGAHAVLHMVDLALETHTIQRGGPVAMATQATPLARGRKGLRLFGYV
jgi:hypothetical protein